MKKLLLSAAIAVLGLSQVNAQDGTTGGFNNGDVYVSGSLGFNSYKYGNSKINSLDFSPSVGYFVSDNIALEFNLLVGSTKDEDDDKTSSFGAGLGANYFFTPANQFSFTLGAGVGYVTNTNKPNGGPESKYNTFDIAIAPGLNYFISEKFALRASIAALSYTSRKADFSGAEAENEFGLNADLSNVNFGVTYKF
jgi:opacity protein-like surface antigen